MKRDEVEFSRLVAGSYERRYVLEPYELQLFESQREILRKLIKCEMRALDIGTGTGRIARFLGETSAGVVASDMSREMLDYARRRVAGVDFVVADADFLPFRADQFDLVAAWGVLHHLFSGEVALREIARTLKSGGLFVFSDPTEVVSGLGFRRGCCASKHEAPLNYAHTERCLNALGFCRQALKWTLLYNIVGRITRAGIAMPFLQLDYSVISKCLRLLRRPGFTVFAVFRLDKRI